MKMIAIAPASFDIYLSVRINYIQNWCGLLLLYLYYRQCEKPVNKIKQIQFPHLFYLLIFPEVTGKNIKHNFMSEEMRKSVSLFCNQQPNLDDLHHPNDIARLIKVIYLSIKNEEEIPYIEIEEGLKSRNFDELNHGTVDSFINSCKTYIRHAKQILLDAQRAEMLK